MFTPSMVLQGVFITNTVNIMFLLMSGWDTRSIIMFGICNVLSMGLYLGLIDNLLKKKR